MLINPKGKPVITPSIVKPALGWTIQHMRGAIDVEARWRLDEWWMTASPLRMSALTAADVSRFGQLCHDEAGVDVVSWLGDDSTSIAIKQADLKSVLAGSSAEWLADGLAAVDIDATIAGNDQGAPESVLIVEDLSIPVVTRRGKYWISEIYVREYLGYNSKSLRVARKWSEAVWQDLLKGEKVRGRAGVALVRLAHLRELLPAKVHDQERAAKISLLTAAADEWIARMEDAVRRVYGGGVGETTDDSCELASRDDQNGYRFILPGLEMPSGTVAIISLRGRFWVRIVDVIEYLDYAPDAPRLVGNWTEGAWGAAVQAGQVYGSMGSTDALINIDVLGLMFPAKMSILRADRRDKVELLTTAARAWLSCHRPADDDDIIDCDVSTEDVEDVPLIIPSENRVDDVETYIEQRDNAQRMLDRALAARAARSETQRRDHAIEILGESLAKIDARLARVESAIAAFIKAASEVINES
jgi:hypothetical protein